MGWFHTITAPKPEESLRGSRSPQVCRNLHVGAAEHTKLACRFCHCCSLRLLENPERPKKGEGNSGRTRSWHADLQASASLSLTQAEHRPKLKLAFCCQHERRVETNMCQSPNRTPQNLPGGNRPKIRTGRGRAGCPRGWGTVSFCSTSTCWHQCTAVHRRTSSHLHYSIWQSIAL